MSRLPQPGGDDGQWGGILNDYLSVEHNSDGTHKLVVNPDATTSSKGKIRLSGDLAGTADAPTVPGLTGKAASGANADITSLLGLTTPLSVAQGGTGNAFGAASLAIAQNGTVAGTRPELNFVPGSRLSLTASDNAGANRLDIILDGVTPATIIVAASNASTRSKAAADYVCSGTSDHVQINAAAAALGSAGGTVQLTEGTFSVPAASLTLRSNLRLRGTGSNSTTILLANGSNGRLISSTASLSSVTLENLTFDGNNTNQADGASRDDLSMLFISNITDFRLIDCTLTNCRHGAALRLSGMTNVVVTGCRFLNNGLAAAAFACDHSYCGDSDYYRVYGNYYDTCYDTGTAQDGVRWSIVTGNVYHNNVLGVSVSASTTRPSTYNTVSGNVVDGTGSSTAALLSTGIKVSKFGSAVAANMTEVTITGNVMRNCDRGMWIEQVDRLLVQGNVIADAAGSNKQLVLFSTVGSMSDVSFDNNLIYNTTNRGISFSSGGTSTNVRVTGNRFITVTTPIGGTIPASTIIARNQGYVTEASGTAVVPSGSTSVVVTHGLSSTPTLNNLTVVPNNSLGTATKFWVSTPTATTFTINVDVDPGATTAQFAWQSFVL